MKVSKFVPFFSKQNVPKISSEVHEIRQINNWQSTFPFLVTLSICTTQEFQKYFNQRDKENTSKIIKNAWTEAIKLPNIFKGKIVKTTVRHHCKHKQNGQAKKKVMPSVDKDVEPPELSYVLMGMEIDTKAGGKWLVVLLWVSYAVSQWFHSVVCSQQEHTRSPRDTYKNIRSSTTHYGPRLKPPECPSTTRRINKWWCRHKMEYYTTMRMRYLQPLATTDDWQTKGGAKETAQSTLNYSFYTKFKVRQH